MCPFLGFIIAFTALVSLRKASMVLYFCRNGAQLRACCTAPWLGWFFPPSRTKLYALTNRSTGWRMVASLKTLRARGGNDDASEWPRAMMCTGIPVLVCSNHPSRGLCGCGGRLSLRRNMSLIADPAVLGT